ncbi:MAG: hypothetical protein ACRDGT_06325 [Candidatus Limnocylindria bacterium]
MAGAAPRLIVEPGGLLSGRTGGPWRAVWVVRNEGDRPVAIVRGWHPHGRFRSSRRRLDLRLRAGHYATFALPARTDVRRREVIANAFLILDLTSARRRWRLVARLRLRGRAGAPPRVTVEAIDVHPATD